MREAGMARAWRIEFEVRSRFLAGDPHEEVPQQKKIVSDMGGANRVKKIAERMGCDSKDFVAGARLRGKAKEKCDLVVHLLWRDGVFKNEDIGRLFGVSYSAVIHRINDMRARLSVDETLRNNILQLHAEFKM